MLDVKKYTLLTFKGICMNFLLKLNFFILSHPVTSKQPPKVVQIHMTHPVVASPLNDVNKIIKTPLILHNFQNEPCAEPQKPEKWKPSFLIEKRSFLYLLFKNNGPMIAFMTLLLRPCTWSVLIFCKINGVLLIRIRSYI